MAATRESSVLDGIRATALTKPSSNCWAAKRCWTKSARSAPKPAPRKSPRPRRRWKRPKRKPKPRAKPHRSRARKRKNSFSPLIYEARREPCLFIARLNKLLSQRTGNCSDETRLPVDHAQAQFVAALVNLHG